MALLLRTGESSNLNRVDLHTHASSIEGGQSLGPLTSLTAANNLNIGAFTLSASQFISTIAGGTAPLVVTSTTKVINLNADLLDGFNTGNASGNIPLSNGTVNTNLNADLLDGLNSGNVSGNIPISNGILNTNLNADMVDGWHAGNLSGQVPVSNTVKNVNLNADLLDGLDSTDFVRATGGVSQIITGSKTFSFTTTFNAQTTFNANGTLINGTSTFNALATFNSPVTLGANGNLINGTTSFNAVPSFNTTIIGGNGGNLEVQGNIIPSANNTYDIGSAALAWKSVYLENGIFINPASSIIADARIALTGTHQLSLAVYNGAYFGINIEPTKLYPTSTNTLSSGDSGHIWTDVWLNNSLYLHADPTAGANNGARIANVSGTLFLQTRGDMDFEVGLGGSIMDVTLDATHQCFRSQGNGIHDLGTITGTAFRWRTIFLTTAPNVSSDLRDKNNIKSTNLGLDFINQLHPVSYNLNIGDTNEKHYGLIAQEVEEVLGNQDFAGLRKPKNENEHYSLAYEELIAPMIKAIQELTEKVKNLEAQLLG